MDNQFHLSDDAAAIYERRKVPAVFAPLARATLDCIDLPKNACILDVATGTGIIPRLLIERLEGSAQIAGIDLNPAMLDVAKRSMPESSHSVEWHACNALQMPFESETFDITFCQQALQFFPDKVAALNEIKRILKPEGRLYLTCWYSLSLMFEVLYETLNRRVNKGVADQAIVPFLFRDGDAVTPVLERAGFNIEDQRTLTIDRVLEPARAAIREELLGTPFAEALHSAGEGTIEGVLDDMEAGLAGYRDGDRISVPQEARLFSVIS